MRTIRRDRGVPRDRYHCSHCGARGVNINSCPRTTQDEHEAQAGPYRQATAEGPAIPTPLPPANTDLTGLTAEQAGRVLQEAGALAADQARHAEEAAEEAAQEQAAEEAEMGRPGGPTWGTLELDQGEPLATLQVSTITVRLATTYPALNAARLEAFIEEQLDECLWLSTDIARLTES
tara:strand:+ start:1108 stop:1641 length:534 start_codon:yes stop_codon:yes gene_type:complete